MTSQQSVAQAIDDLIQKRAPNAAVRQMLHSILEELFRDGGVDFKFTKQEGVTLYRGPRDPDRRFCNLFPHTSFQFVHRGKDLAQVAQWVDRGPEYYILYFKEAPSGPALRREALRLCRWTYELARADGQRRHEGSPPPALVPYELPQMVPTSAHRDPFRVDPNVIDRGTRAHQEIVRKLWKLCRKHGLQPMTRPGGPEYDIGWECDGVFVVVEVKSLTADNEVMQMRLGLGQVLDYRAELLADGRWKKVKAILAVEKEPDHRRWLRLCESLGVKLVWDGTLEEAIG